MTRRSLTDEEIAEALLEGSGAGSPAKEDEGAFGRSASPSRRACAHEDRLWDLARGALDPDEAARILDHTLECPSCSLAMRVAHETFAVSGLSSEPPRASSARPGVWSWLSASLLQPAPALVYLVLLILSFPLYRLLAPSAPAPTEPGHPSGGTAITVTPGAPAGGGASTEGPGAPGTSHAGGTVPELRRLRVLRLTGDLSLRGASAPPEPARIGLGEGEALVLRLFPDAEGLPKDPGSGLVVRVLDGGTVVASMARLVGDLEADHSLSLLLERAALQPGKPYVVELSQALAVAGSGAPPAGRGPVVAQGPPILRQSFMWERN